MNSQYHVYKEQKYEELKQMLEKDEPNRLLEQMEKIRNKEVNTEKELERMEKL